MNILVRILMPTFSCFGPLFMVLGLESPNRSPVNNFLAFSGAFMVSAALVMVFFALLKLLGNRSS